MYTKVAHSRWSRDPSSRRTTSQGLAVVVARQADDASLDLPELLGDRTPGQVAPLEPLVVPAHLVGRVAPVPVAQQLLGPGRHLLGRHPGRDGGGRVLTEQCQRQLGAGEAGGRVGERDHPDVVQRVREQGRLEPGHRAGVTHQQPVRVGHDPHPEPVVGGGRHRLPHLDQRLAGEHVGVPVGQERGEAGQVLDRAPELTGRCHRPGVVQRLLGEGASEMVHAQSAGVRLLREVRRPRHRERLGHARLHQVGPGTLPHPATASPSRANPRLL